MRGMEDVGTDDYLFQVTTAFVVVLTVKGMLRKRLGTSPPTRRHPSHYSLKRGTQMLVAGWFPK